MPAVIARQNLIFYNPGMKRLTAFTNNQPANNHRRGARQALEAGGIVLLEQQPFVLKAAEQKFLTPEAVSPKRKNISYNPRLDELKGDVYQGEVHQQLQALMRRYHQFAMQLVESWFPEYAPELIHGRGSLRVVEAAGRAQSPRQDDRHLHVDAFPATPLQGQRILRVFSNINPQGKPRVWRIGEAFPDLLRRFAPTLRCPPAWQKYLLRWLRVTKQLRTDYDALMLQLHHTMKADLQYQETVDQEQISLPAASTWFVFTDQASHAVCSGQFCLEQTFYLPPTAKSFPETSPLRVLERWCHKILA